jgi:hypothetical protein
MAGRPIDHRGFPVPWFVTAKDDRGLWEFRAVEAARLAEAINRRVCWICGQPLGRAVAFAIGPMCTINRISAEPPQHLECAVFAARACPFMATPAAVRRERGLEDRDCVGGIMIKRNPGVVAVWACREFRMEMRPGPIFRLSGEPMQVLWFREGREAMRAEVEASIARGLPLLRELAEQDGAKAVLQLGEQERVARERYLPRAA